MANFNTEVNIEPTYGQQKRSAPNVRTVRFADGYEHRILLGLAQNQNPKVFNFTFEEKIYQKKIRFNASDEIVKQNENLIIDNNDDFVV